MSREAARGRRQDWASLVGGLAGLVVVGVLLAGCLVDRSGGLFIQNVGDQVVTGAWYEGPEGDVFLAGRMDPGHASRVTQDIFAKTDGCSVGDLVASGEGGVEIARRSQPICHGETWLIGEEEASPRS